MQRISGNDLMKKINREVRSFSSSAKNRYLIAYDPKNINVIMNFSGDRWMGSGSGSPLAAVNEALSSFSMGSLLCIGQRA